MSCGGGSSSTSPTSTGGSSIKIELVNPSLRGKFAILDENSPFRISSDLSDRDDPNEATHVRVRFIQDGHIVREQIEAIQRASESPYQVDSSSRFITIHKIPLGKLTLEVQLGRDFGSNDINRRERIFYQGTTENIEAIGNNFQVEGVDTTVIHVPIRSFIDPTGLFYSIQGYHDFSQVPSVLDGEVEPTGDFGLTAVTSFIPMLKDFAPSFNAINLVTAEIDVFQSQFFEVNLPVDEKVFFVVGESGPPRNIVIHGIVTEQEALEGKPILIDWETTQSKILTHWYLYRKQRDGVFTMTRTNFVETYALINEKITKRLISLTTDPPVAGEFRKIDAGELAILQFVYLFTRELYRGDPLGLTLAPIKLDTKVVTAIGSNPTLGPNFFFFNKEKVNIPLEVTLPNNGGTLQIGAIIDGATSLTITENGVTTSDTLVNVFSQKIAAIAFSDSYIHDWITERLLK